MEFADDQTLSRIELIDGTFITKCEQCKQMYSDRNPPEDPPCKDCRVELMPENMEAAAVYRAVRGQVISMFNGERSVVVDINHHAIHLAMDRMGITDQRSVFDKVVKCFHYFLKEKNG